MPICEADPWRMQYFEDVACPGEVRIPTEDGDAWAWYPEYKWVYNKLAIAESQSLPCGPHGLDPPSFPVFSKPIQVAVIADIPDAVATQRSAPSIAASLSSNARTVGLVKRE